MLFCCQTRTEKFDDIVLFKSAFGLASDSRIVLINIDECPSCMGSKINSANKIPSSNDIFLTI
jgi:hypothetical protein